ncbi:hypothetical protein E5F05_20925 [Deinococcus metallilatus]|uniref:Uncharacterized protein n=1 Tax=Deinococcus metallilatus TaxID=1211322 RepID=A0AAJ5F4G4_9DEIO|nr:hypothetical protein [Deinococcus metallilatus]MBB5294438.1 hypothetical protein [Deinococcus metallilatus]QBY10185.1 hypothetical protein E5F05_20925 [Deinococcus metallilatus]RXJ13911.1 hypothetical protein ERJ73_04575 [Deinococcus metallilatus]TLK29877.1 hypothetical protein FCS05_04890 [Deinococcus metallilatus]GMA15654.1 hypothetical protein GCM10025871_19850 [Deinococcus metallilatus]
MKVVQRWGGLALCLSGLALAGGGGPPAPLTRDAALRRLPGVTVTEAPTGNFEVDSARWMSGVGYAYAAQVRVGTKAERVLLSPVAIDNSSTVNSLRAYVETTSPTASQRQALVHVARSFLQGCAPEQAAQAQSIWPGLARHDWTAALGWQERQLGSVRVGWSRREGLNVAGHEAAGLSVDWPRSSGRCVF